VLYVDGEMPAATMQERLRAISRSTGEIAPGMFRLVTPDIQEGGIPSLLTREGRALVEEHLSNVAFLVLDNLSSLIRGGKENDADSWGVIQEWILSLRSRHIAVVMDHHASRSGAPRGTSGREDVLDTTILLDRPEDYQPEQGARFVIRLRKARGIYGKAAVPIEVQLHIEQGAAVWLVKEAGEDIGGRVRQLRRDGESIRGIAQLLGIDKGRVERILRPGGVS
jgi:putative DNA primase/helicase